MYLQTLGAAPYFLGLSLSAFSLSGLLSGPLFGHLSDKTRTTKKIILFANCFEIIGRGPLTSKIAFVFVIYSFIAYFLLF